MTKIQLKRSSVLVSGSAKVPTSGQLDYGELAVAYNTSDPQLFFKDSSGSVVSFFDRYASLSGASFTGDVSFATDVDFDGSVTIKGDSTNGSGKLTLTCENDTHSVHIKAPANSASANYTLTLPTTAGTSNQVLATDGSGNLSWAVSTMSVADKLKLDGIETSATADQTGAEIKTLYEAETNAFTDALFTKLSGIETGATGDQTAAEILTALLTVDGAGSGLDADLLDGAQTATAHTADTIVLRDGNADIRGRYIYAGTTTANDGWFQARSGADTGVNAAITPTSYIVESGGWYYHLPKSNFQTDIGAGLVADKAKLLKTNGSYQISASTLPASYLYGQQIDFVSANEGWFSYGTVITTQSYAGGGATLQMYVPYSSSYGGESLKYRMGNYGSNNGNSWTSWRTIWDSNNDGAGSGLDADNLDGFTWGSYGKDVMGADFYANNWFRNNTASYGIYNAATDSHFFSADANYWHINSDNGLVFYDVYNASGGNSGGRKGYVYHSSDGFGLLNSGGYWCVSLPYGSSSTNALIVGGHNSNNNYSSVASTRMTFGGGANFSNYHFGTNSENFAGNYTKLDLRWHTGIRIGAHKAYGGIRFYNDENLSNLQWHFNHNSNGYTYKYEWLHTDTNGFFSSANSAHMYPNDASTYGAWNVKGARNNYSGINIQDNAGYYNTIMFYQGNGGLYQENGYGWGIYINRSHGCVGIMASSTSSSYGLYVTGGVYTTGSFVASDRRAKTNIETIKSALSKVLNIRGVTYNRINIDDSINEKTEIGVIAQEIEEILPEVVNYAEDIDEYAVSYAPMTALLVEAIKEQHNHIQQMQSDISELQAKLT